MKIVFVLIAMLALSLVPPGKGDLSDVFDSVTDVVTGGLEDLKCFTLDTVTSADIDKCLNFRESESCPNGCLDTVDKLGSGCLREKYKDLSEEDQTTFMSALAACNVTFSPDSSSLQSFSAMLVPAVAGVATGMLLLWGV